MRLKNYYYLCIKYVMEGSPCRSSHVYGSIFNDMIN